MSLGSQIGTADSEAQLASLSKALTAEVRGHLRIGGISIQITGSRRTDVTFDLEHDPFRVMSEVADIDIEVKWVEDLAPTHRRAIFDSGTTWRLYRREEDFQFDFLALGLPYKRLFVDDRFQRATVEMSAAHFEPFPHLAGPLGYPLDELLIMHRLTQEKAIELHGCGIVCADGIANLFVGHSGAGKSTTTRLWTSSRDVEVLSDDRIILRRDDESKKQVPRFARNDKTSGNDDLVGNGKTLGISAFRTGVRMYGTPWHGEAMYASPNSAPLARILILEHGHGNVLTPLSPSEAVAELFARSFVPFHRHEYVDSALAFLEEVVEAVPVYHFAFEPDQRAVDTILNLHD